MVIGRNEGERLKRCIGSLKGSASAIVYVDSRSTDGSADWARSQGVHVVDLDLSLPFTAARARNAGYRRLKAEAPDIDAVQFVDGDCEVQPGWLAAAAGFLAGHAEVAAVFGRRRESDPGQSIYVRMCDREWDTPLGESRACGGDVLMRCRAFDQVGGFRDDLIAGEEPELCVRIRAAGWRIWRLPDEMTLHDAAITRLGQWWRRARRGGHAYAEGASLHGAPPERHWVAETRRAVLWGAVLPLSAAALGLGVHPLGWLLLLAYPAQVARLAWRDRHRPEHALGLSTLLVLARLPEAQGVIQFWLNRARRRRAALIEYK
ncbi:MAG: glycosyltransferase [Burkholderiaceae bacterium]